VELSKIGIVIFRLWPRVIDGGIKQIDGGRGMDIQPEMIE